MAYIKKNNKLNNNNYKNIDSYVEAIEFERVDAIKKLTTNVIREDIVLKIYKNDKLTVKRLKFILEKCMNYLYISNSLIKSLIKNNDVELLKIIFNSINFFDNDFIKIILLYYKNKTPIAKSDFIQQIKKYKVMINEDAFKNFYNYDCGVFLFCACKNKNEYFAKFLIKNGANVNKENKFEETPLFYACDGGNEKIVKYLIEYGVDIDKINNNEETPLFYACRNGNIILIKYLIEYGANINQRNHNKETPLLLACKFGNETTVKYLIEHGANINQKSRYGEGPLFYAYENGNVNIVKYLIEHGADMNEKSRTEKQLLFDVCDDENEEMINILVKYGANVNVKNYMNQTPLLLHVEEEMKI